MCSFAFISGTHLAAKVVFVIMTILVFGTYRRFRLTAKSLQTRWTVGFLDLQHTSARLKRFTFLEVKYEPPTGAGEFLLFGPLAFFWGWIVDFFFPWVGGAYQIWLNDEADRRVLAWQGNSEANYRRNLELIQSVTGLRHRMR